MRWRWSKPWEIALPVAGVALAIVGAWFAVRAADAASVATWRRALEQERDEHRARVDAWLDAGRMTARLAAGYPTARYVVEGRTDEPRPFPATEGAVPHLVGLLGELCRESGFDAAFVVSAGGAVVAATPATVPATDDLAAARAALTATGGVASLTRDAAGATARFAAPIRGDGPTAAALGAVVLREPAARRLYPAISRRVNSDVPVEILLVERTADGLRAVTPPTDGAEASVPAEARAPRDCLDGDDLDAEHSETGTDGLGREVIVAHGRLHTAPWVIVCSVRRDDVVGRSRGTVLSLGFGAAAATLGLALALFGIRQRRAAEQRVATLAAAARLEHALDRGDDVALFVREDGTVTEAHGAVPAVYGVEHAALVGRRLGDFGLAARHGQDSLEVPSAGVRTVETVHVRAGGQEVPVEVSLQRIDGGGPDAVALVRVRDVTERRRGEDRLRALNRLLRMRSALSQALASASDRATVLAATCRIATEEGGYRLAWVGEPVADGRVVPVAVAGAARAQVASLASRWDGPMTGRGPAGRAAAERRTVACAEIAADPACAPWVDAARAAGVRSSVAVPFGAADAGRAAAVLVLHAAEPSAFDGEVLAVAESVAADVAGALDRVAARAAEQEAEGRLRASEAAHRLLFESNPSPMWVYDVETLRIVRVNDAAVAAYGYSRDELKRMTVADLRPPEDRAALLAHVREPVTSSVPTEWRHVRKDGTVFQAGNGHGCKLGCAALSLKAPGL